LATGQVKVDRTRPVAIEDLLGREQVELDSVGIDRLIHDRVVLVTGAGGSIGSELCRQILEKGPRRLILIDQTEIALFEIENELLATPDGKCILPLIADITDLHSMRAIFATYRPEIVFHAAAHKHVPLMERQPCEAIKNNTFGTAQLARLASEHEVERFVLISTDKAINPTSVMGCSKRLAEKALQARQRTPGNKTRFLAVRFGNVLGSSGSVIPTFRRQIARGGPVTVTHPEMTRYFMTIPEAVGLVLQTATLGTGGEIFILDMGKPVKIIDMARQMIELSGFKPDVDIEIRITGLRPGEKLYEELRHTDESHETTVHPRVYRLKAAPDSVAERDDGWLTALRVVADTGNAAEIKAAMKRLVPEYTPYEE
jgi:FlaA1/EpsC-like NDP-sugar epimerase